MSLDRKEDEGEQEERGRATREERCQNGLAMFAARNETAGGLNCSGLDEGGMDSLAFLLENFFWFDLILFREPRWRLPCSSEGYLDCPFAQSIMIFEPCLPFFILLLCLIFLKNKNKNKSKHRSLRF